MYHTRLWHRLLREWRPLEFPGWQACPSRLPEIHGCYGCAKKQLSNPDSFQKNINVLLETDAEKFQLKKLKWEQTNKEGESTEIEGKERKIYLPIFMVNNVFSSFLPL